MRRSADELSQAAGGPSRKLSADGGGLPASLAGARGGVGEDHLLRHVLRRKRLKLPNAAHGHKANKREREKGRVKTRPGGHLEVLLVRLKGPAGILR